MAKSKPAKELKPLVDPEPFTLEDIVLTVVVVLFFGCFGVASIITHELFTYSVLFFGLAGFAAIIPAIEIVVYKMRCHLRERAKLK